MSPIPWADARTRIEASGLLPAAAMAWPNEPFTKPVRTLFAYIEAEGDLSRPIEIGPDGVWEETGQLYIHVVAPVNYGSADCRTLAKAFADLFRNANSLDQPTPPIVSYLSASIGAGSTDTDGPYWRMTVSIAWRYQDV